MSVRIRETAPDFNADTTTGPIDFRGWAGVDGVFIFSQGQQFFLVSKTKQPLTARWASYQITE